MKKFKIDFYIELNDSVGAWSSKTINKFSLFKLFFNIFFFLLINQIISLPLNRVSSCGTS